MSEIVAVEPQWFLGHVYVIAFSSSVIKVGKSRNPEQRLANHEAGAAIHGASIAKSWVSPPHVDYCGNEAKLISFCTPRASASIGAEYFQGLDFDQVVQFAAGLVFDKAPPVTAQISTKEARQAIRALAPGAEILRRIHAGELVYMEREAWESYERCAELLAELSLLLSRLGIYPDGLAGPPMSAQFFDEVFGTASRGA